MGGVALAEKIEPILAPPDVQKVKEELVFVLRKRCEQKVIEELVLELSKTHKLGPHDRVEIKLTEQGLSKISQGRFPLRIGLDYSTHIQLAPRYTLCDYLAPEELEEHLVHKICIGEIGMETEY